MYENLKEEIDTFNDYIKGNQKNDNKEKEKNCYRRIWKSNKLSFKEQTLYDINDYKRRLNIVKIKSLKLL